MERQTLEERAGSALWARNRCVIIACVFCAVTIRCVAEPADELYVATFINAAVTSLFVMMALHAHRTHEICATLLARARDARLEAEEE